MWVDEVSLSYLSVSHGAFSPIVAGLEVQGYLHVHGEFKGMFQQNRSVLPSLLYAFSI